LHLKTKGYTVHIIKPNFEKNNATQNEFKSVYDIPKGENNLLLLTNPTQTFSLIKSTIKLGIKKYIDSTQVGNT